MTATVLTGATSATPYSQTLAASGGQPPYSWNLLSGALPNGITLATNGVLSGTSTTGGIFFFDVQVTDSMAATATQTLALIVMTNAVISPGRMALIPSGWFVMGNSIGDGDITDATTTNIYVSAFYMDTNLVSYDQWQTVYAWAINHGYGFSQCWSGQGGKSSGARR